MFYTHGCCGLELVKATMVEEIINSGNKPKNKTTRPRPVYLWNVLDVQKWLRRHCSDYYQLYHEKFLHHDITGRVLLRINENILLRLGVDNEQHRMDIWREIMKLHLKTDMLEIRELERRNNMNFD
ncbi:PREDICTED: protein aveugle isoform X2 [Dinoponera quadriceps]|uniref:Protein aveugle isoform X2 n=1 Tax=Dinoponera quadriceps TaxID=609295 RepID=A0A6P3XIL9_DINQU|nr:PREDICTED: protein aveugle isoform X2 [Dinoponera quadriceps]